MKKSFIIIVALCLIAFVSCSDPIFYNISQEIALSDPSVTHDIVSIAEFDGSLYLANGNIYSKSGTSRWKKQPKTGINANVVAVYADDSNLYAYDANNTIWTKTCSTDWQKVETDVVMVFDNTPASTKNVYFKKEVDKENKTFKILKLNGASAPTDITDSITTADIIGKQEIAEVVKAISVNGTEYFSSTSAIAYKNNVVYHGSSSSIKYIDYGDPDPTPQEAISVGNSVKTLCVVGNTLYIGTNSGLKMSTIGDDNMLSAVSKVIDDNSTSAFGTREVVGIWNFADKIYVASRAKSSSLYGFLWSYNDATKKWNKE